MAKPMKQTATAMEKVWFITGSSRGLGRALVEAVLQDTDDLVVATSRDPSTLDGLVDRFGDRVATPRLDVTDPGSIEAAVGAVHERFGCVDVLVNNAGYGLLGAFEELTDAQIRAQFDVNLFGAMDVTRLLLPSMRSRRSGLILQISSVAGQVGFPAYSAYCASKFALEGWSDSLRIELQSFGIGVVTVEPGGFLTDWAGSSLVQADCMDAYLDTRSGRAARERAAQENGSQPGDPMRAALALIQLAASPTKPERIPLGRDSFEGIAAQLQHRLSGMAEWTSLATSTDFENGDESEK